MVYWSKNNKNKLENISIDLKQRIREIDLSNQNSICVLFFFNKIKHFFFSQEVSFCWIKKYYNHYKKMRKIMNRCFPC